MFKFIAIILFSLSLNSFSEDIKIAVSDTNLGGISQNLIKSIISCSTKIPEKKIKISTFPSLRGMQELIDQSVDGFYPVAYNSKSSNHGLFPLYIDEVLMISLKNIKNAPIHLGIVKGDNHQYLETIKNYNLSFSVANSNTLLRGLENMRADAVIVKRSEIPQSFSFEKFNLKSLDYLESGIDLNASFYKKVGKSRDEVRKLYVECLEKVNFILEHKRRDDIALKVLEDVRRLQKSFKMSRRNISDIKNKDKIWKREDLKSSLVKDVLKSNESQRLKNDIKDLDFINEAFIFNHQGAILGETLLTSDFDQSDEEKYKLIKNQKKFDGNNITDIYFDPSSGAFQIGIMIRLEDKSGNFSGGIYLGANINKILTHYKIN